MLVNMKEMLEKARAGKYAVGFFNAVNIEMARAVIETAEEMRSPVIVGTAEVLLPAMPLERVAEYLVPMAEKASVPVAVHYDHGLSFEKCMEALHLGFTSVMYDCSTSAYEDNLKNVAEMVKICHAVGATVEGELGHVGDNEGAGKLVNPSDYYRFPPKLDFDRISVISSMTGTPLVLHGGSGLSDDDFREAAARGICKVNIFTDLDKAGKAGIEEGLRAGAGTVMQLIPFEIESMKQVVRNKLSLFGSVNHA